MILKGFKSYIMFRVFIAWYEFAKPYLLRKEKPHSDKAGT